MLQSPHVLKLLTHYSFPLQLLADVVSNSAGFALAIIIATTALTARTSTQKRDALGERGAVW